MGSATGNIREAAESSIETDVDVELTREERFHLLSNERRCLTVRYLLTAQPTEPVDLSTLADEVCALEQGTDVNAINATERKRVYVALRQSHLPALDRANVIEFNTLRGTVEPADGISQLAPYITDDTRTSVPIWQRFYLGLTLFAIGAIALTTAEVGPLTSLSGIEIAIIIAVALTVVTTMFVVRTLMDER